MFPNVTANCSAEANYRGWEVEEGKHLTHKSQDLLLSMGLSPFPCPLTTEHKMS